MVVGQQLEEISLLLYQHLALGLAWRSWWACVETKGSSGKFRYQPHFGVEDY
jgi:hypothetical protein